MKKFALILLMLFTLLSLCACFGGDGGGEDSGEKVIFSKDTQLTVIRGEGAPDTDELSQVINKIRDATGRMPVLRDAFAEKQEHEIIFGDTDRELTKAAKELLVGDGDAELSYVIYSDGTSVAVVYRDNADGIARRAATEELIAAFDGKDSLVMDAGAYKVGSIDVMEYYEELGEKQKSDAYAALTLAAGEDIANAVRDLYSLYSRDVIYWFANLYDSSICFCGECEFGSGCAGGAFYYSPSARDTGGYLPDAESTYQILSTLAGSGMANGRGGRYSDLLFEKIKEDIITFARALQHPNGYFYHPQWGKDLTDTKISRRSRDLDWCTSMLGALGSMPIYDAPNGTKGENRNTGAAFMLTEALGVDTGAMVSKLVSVASVSYAAHLESDVTFRAYLAKMDIKNRSYHVGSELVTQDSQIIARDKQLAEDGKDYSLMKILIDWLDENQDANTGHWHTVSDYYAVNGLYKIARIYNAAGVAMKHADRAAESAIAAITSDEKPGAVVDPYNIWAAISNCLSNLRKYGGEGGIAEATEIAARLRESAPEAIAATKAKVATFLKEDGSFSYLEGSSAHTSQGVPAAVQGTNEGDVNATTIAIVSLTNSIYSALGLSDFKIPIFTYIDYIEFEKTILSLGPVVKNTVADADEPSGFDDDDIGGLPSGVTTVTESAGEISVADDPRADRDGNVLSLKSLSGGRDFVLVPCKNAAENAPCYVFEGSMCVTSTDPSYTTQITMGSCYMLTLRAGSDGRIKLVEASSNSEVVSKSHDLGVSVAIGEWFDLRIEYYKGDHDSVRIKVYFNGALAAVSDNYYDASGTKLSGKGSPSSLYDNTRILVMRSSAATILLDDLAAYKSDTVYEKPVGDGPVINVDAPEKPFVYENFEDGQIPKSIDPTNESSGGSTSVTLNPSGEGRVLELKSFAGGRDFIYLNTQEKSDANCYVFEGDFLVASTDPTYTVQITMGAVYMLTLRAEADGTVRIVEASSNSESKSKTQDLGLKVRIGEWFNLRVEYYLGDHESVRIKIYFNGTLAAVTDNYYDASGNKLTSPGKPSTDYGSVRIIVMRSYNATLLMDNLAAYKTEKEYERCDEDLIINADKNGN